MMDEFTQSRKDAMREIVKDTRISTGMFSVPPASVEHLDKKNRVDFLDVIEIEVQHLDDSTHKVLLFWSEAMEVFEALESWLSAQHEMGRCGCGEHGFAQK